MMGPWRTDCRMLSSRRWPNGKGAMRALPRLGGIRMVHLQASPSPLQGEAPPPP